MPIYECPKCGRRVELPEGTYYCKVCGPEAIMRKVSGEGGTKEELYGKLLEVLEEAYSEVDEARTLAMYSGDFSEIHRHIQRAHEKLRTASRIMGYRPSAK